MANSNRNSTQRKNRHPNWPLRLILGAVFLSLLLTVVVVPLLQYRAYYQNFDVVRLGWIAYPMMKNFSAWAFLIWVFFFGASLGSFLNVFAYRVPNKITMLGPSRCPYCRVPIQGKHNLPILGWFAVRGRCATCRLPISYRYFIVEIIAGALLLFLVLSELVSQGDYLPTDRVFRVDGLVRDLLTWRFQQLGRDEWTLIRIFLVHCLVGYSILTAALMRLDRFRLPTVWKGVQLVLVFSIIALCPNDFEFARSTFQNPGQLPGFLQRVDFQLTGFLVGSVIGFQYTLLTKDWNSGAVFGFGLTGACFGLSATLSMGTLFLLLIAGSFAVQLHRQALRQPLFVLFLAFVLQLLFWKPLSQIEMWPNASTSAMASILLLVPGAITAFLVRWIQKTPSRQP